MDDWMWLENKWLYNNFVVKEKLSGHLGEFSFLLLGYTLLLGHALFDLFTTMDYLC